MYYETFEDRGRKSKYREHNGHENKDKGTNEDL